MGEPLFFDSLRTLVRILVAAPVLYLSVVFFVRLAGKRTTSQMNNFDWIMTVAMGSLVGSTILLKDVTIAEGLVAIAAIVALQWGLTKLAVNSPNVAAVVKAEPALLFDRGRFLPATLRRERVSEAEVRSAVREAGYSSLEDVQWVVLEDDASFSVLPRRDHQGRPDAMETIFEP